MPQQRKTPTERTAGAFACVVDTESKIAFRQNNNTSINRNATVASLIAQKDARKRGAPRAECRTGNCAAASEKKFNTVSPLKAIGRREVIHHDIESNLASEKKTPALEQTGAEASFTDTQFPRGVSVRARSTPLLGGATATNAWLPARFYRVDASLGVELLA